MPYPAQGLVSIAIVGVGLIGPRHAEAVHNNPHTKLACIVDPNPAAKAVAERFECSIYENVEQMLSQSIRVDAALVCTPNHTHVAISKALLKGGLHVLCEKPISVDVSSGKELVEFAETCGRKLMIGHHRRFNRFVLATKQALPSLGRIIAINGLWAIYKPSEYFEPPTLWRRLDSAGPVLINLVHEIDILHYWCGPITRVFAEKAMSQRGFEAEEGAAITLRFANGIVGTFVLSDAVVSPHSFEAGTGENPIIPRVGCDSYRILGSKGSLSFPDLMKWTYPGKQSWSERLECEQLDVSDTKVPFDLQIENFVRVIKGEDIPMCSGRDGLRAVAVCEAVKQSMREGLPVDIAPESV